MRQLKAEEVIAFALSEVGEDCSVEQVAEWISDESPESPPPSAAAKLSAILRNLDYHIRVAQARAISDKEIVDDSLRKIASLPRNERKLRAKAYVEQRAGEVSISPGMPLYLSPESEEAYRAIKRALGISGRAFISMILDACLKSAIEMSSDVNAKAKKYKPVKRNLKRRRGLPSATIKKTIRYVQEMQNS